MRRGRIRKKAVREREDESEESDTERSRVEFLSPVL